MSELILAIDQGTTGTTVLLIDRQLQVRARANVEFPQHFPQPGWVEHKPDEIWASVSQAVIQLLQQGGHGPDQIAAIGITNQRETIMLWDRQTSHPCGNAIVWQDRRSAGICSELKQKGLEELFRHRTGLVFDPYFSGTKLTWMLRRDEELRRRAPAGELACGTIDSYLVWQLTGGEAHVTDVSNASRTLLLDLEECQWNPALADQLEVPMELLPRVCPSASVYGRTRGLGFLPDGIPISGMAGDQQAALFGQACFSPGDGKCTYGTGAFLLVNTGDRPVVSDNGLLSTIAWQIEGKTCYALEGSSFIAGAAVQWLRDGLGIIDSAAEIESLAAEVEDSGGVVFVPALAGLGAPHWRSDARGLISGLTRGSGRAHLARAALEGIALQIYELAAAMASDRGEPLADFKVDGGAAANNLLMQYQADLLQTDVIRPQTLETTALGAAMLAGVGIGWWQDLEELRDCWQEERRFGPLMADENRQALLNNWRTAVQKA